MIEAVLPLFCEDWNINFSIFLSRLYNLLLFLLWLNFLVYCFQCWFIVCFVAQGMKLWFQVANNSFFILIIDYFYYFNHFFAKSSVVGVIGAVTCLFLSQSLWFHTIYVCPWWWVWGSAHTPYLQLPTYIFFLL